MTANASGTLGSGTCVQPCGIGKVRSRALKSFACCGSSLTFLLPKNSRSVPELAGVSSGGAATGGAGGSPGAAGATAGAIGAGAAAAVPGIGLPTAPGTTATACGIGAAGAGLGRGGNTGSADAVGMARPKTPAAPTARPATVTRQLRAVCFMRVGPSQMVRRVFMGLSKSQKATVTRRKGGFQGWNRAAIHLGQTPDRSAIQTRPSMVGGSLDAAL